MEIVKHPLCTAVIGAPSDMQDGSCSGLPVAYHTDQYGTWALSFWQPDGDELATLASGGGIVLHVRAPGRQHPVIGMSTYRPIDSAEHGAEAPADSTDARATWSTRTWAEHVGASEDEAGLVRFGSWMAVHAMLLQFQAMTARELAGRGTRAALDVLAERRRQVEQEGFSHDQDDAHENGELAEAAICYASPAAHCQLGIPQQWPWIADWWKPRDRRHNLVRAGALILAEIERIDRAEQKV